MVPKPALVGCMFGAPKTGWFSRLNASARNWKNMRSLIENLLLTEASKLFCASWRRPAIVVGNVRRWKAYCPAFCSSVHCAVISPPLHVVEGEVPVTIWDVSKDETP